MCVLCLLQPTQYSTVSTGVQQSFATPYNVATEGQSFLHILLTDVALMSGTMSAALFVADHSCLMQVRPEELSRADKHDQTSQIDFVTAAACKALSRSSGVQT